MREPNPFRVPTRIAAVGAVLTVAAVCAFFISASRGPGPMGSRAPATITLSGPPPAPVERDGAVEVDLPDAGDRQALARADWPPERWAALLAVRVAAAGGSGADVPPLAGSYSVEGGRLRFVPRFPLAPGVRYRAVFEPSRLPSAPAGAEQRVLEFRLPRPERPATAVAHVYPSADELPENLLRFYLHFTAPMGRGGAYEHVRLLAEDGKPIELPFLELDEELWSDDNTRLTLFIDPGRIKRGLKPREDVGPVLEDGKRYTLVIDRDWPDAGGAPLREGYRKSFRAAAPREAAVDPKTWKLRPPAAGTRDPLTVAFPAPLDHALLLRLLAVTDAGGRPVAGTAAATQAEAGWTFTPGGPWAEGEYRLVADARLEDVAGNRVGRPFEVDLSRGSERPAAAAGVVPFTVGPRPPAASGKR